MTMHRPHDLVAKVAHVSLRNTVRVLKAIALLDSIYGVRDMAVALSRHPLVPATPEEIDACEREYLRLRTALVSAGRLHVLTDIKALR